MQKGAFPASSLFSLDSSFYFTLLSERLRLVQSFELNDVDGDFCMSLIQHAKAFQLFAVRGHIATFALVEQDYYLAVFVRLSWRDWLFDLDHYCF